MNENDDMGVERHGGARGDGSSVGQAIATTILTLLLILNVGAGTVSGIWLAIKGEWALIGFGVALAILMPWMWIIASLPTMAFVGIAERVAEARNRIGMALCFFVLGIYNGLLIAWWTYYVFITFVASADSTTLIPVLLWGYATTMSPLGYMASKGSQDDEDVGTGLGLLLAQLSYFLLVALFFLEAERLTAIWLLIGLCVLEALLLTLHGLTIASPPSETAPTYPGSGDDDFVGEYEEENEYEDTEQDEGDYEDGE